MRISGTEPGPALFKLQRDFLCQNPSISSALHVFNHTIKPI